MYILIDGRIPSKSKEKLSEYGQLIEFTANNSVYQAISGHPDIFCCNINNKLIIAPETKFEIINIFEKLGIEFIFGKSKLGKKYPETACYNAVVTDKYLIHNLKITDSIILDYSKNLSKIHVNQGYTRCNLIALDNDYFITSDMGIYNKLSSLLQNKVFYVNPRNITLPTLDYGFFGGCCGYYNKTLFIAGHIRYLPEYKQLNEFIEKSGNSLINLADHRLFDGGGIFFIDK
jgi:hypothetical protein